MKERVGGTEAITPDVVRWLSHFYIVSTHPWINLQPHDRKSRVRLTDQADCSEGTEGLLLHEKKHRRFIVFDAESTARGGRILGSGI